jgi:hypothetical protein
MVIHAAVLRVSGPLGLAIPRKGHLQPPQKRGSKLNIFDVERKV